MHRNLVIATVLSVVTLPVLALGLIDPLEGGLAMLVAGAMILATWLVARVPVPALEWTAWTTAIVTGGLAILGVWRTYPLPVPTWVWVLVVAYEIAVALTLAGAGIHVARHVRRLRAGRHTPTQTRAA